MSTKIIVGLIVAIWIMVQITVLYLDRKKEREKKTFANQPINVLKNFMLMDIEVASLYHHMKMVMPDKDATEIAIDRYLFKLGLLGYREDKENEG